MDLKFDRAIGTDHCFHFLADGDRPALEIWVDAKPGVEKLPIFVNAVGAPRAQAQTTAGITHVDAKPIVDSDGAPLALETRVCIGCIATYIVPRIVTMMTRVYVPKLPISQK